MTGPKPNSDRAVAECCFLDVGQGTCNVILLGNNRAIVIDCGPRHFSPVRCLEYFSVREIEALVISHNDEDHLGGAFQLIPNYSRQIKQVYFLDDRPVKDNRVFSIVKQERAAGRLIREPIRLEADSAKGKRIFYDSARSLSLHVLFPWMLANIEERERDGKNKTSAVLALQCGKRRIVFGGDLEIDGWKALQGKWKAPIACDILTVPHHGGALYDGNVEEKYLWLYHEAINCRNAVVSVGTNNSHKHPLSAHIQAIRASRANVLCTQITPRCCDDADLEKIRPGVIAPQLPGASSPTEDRARTSNRSRRIACAGSVLVEIGPEVIKIDRLKEHQAAVDALVSKGRCHPLCRYPSST